MTILTMDCWYFERGMMPMQMTMFEKRDLIERVTTLVRYNVLSREDRDDIFRICLAACDRAIAREGK